MSLWQNLFLYLRLVPTSFFFRYHSETKQVSATQHSSDQHVNLRGNDISVYLAHDDEEGGRKRPPTKCRDHLFDLRKSPELAAERANKAAPRSSKSFVHCKPLQTGPTTSYRVRTRRRLPLDFYSGTVAITWAKGRVFDNDFSSNDRKSARMIIGPPTISSNPSGFLPLGWLDVPTGGPFPTQGGQERAILQVDLAERCAPHLGEAECSCANHLFRWCWTKSLVLTWAHSAAQRAVDIIYMARRDGKSQVFRT